MLGIRYSTSDIRISSVKFSAILEVQETSDDSLIQMIYNINTFL